MSYVSQEDIFKGTNGGLDVILRYFPDAVPGKKFKLRTTEKTASSTLKQMPDGNWVVTDFGGDQKPRNAIALVMEEERCDFKRACQLIGEEFGIITEAASIELFKADVRQRDAAPEEEDGQHTFVYGEYTEKDLRVIFADQVINHVQEQCKKAEGKDDWQTVLSKLCKKYYMHKVAHLTTVSKRKHTTISSTEYYPIFCFEISEKIKKIYQPLAQNKSNRFSFYGGKPDDHIFGLAQCTKAFNDYQEQQMADLAKEPQSEDDDEAPKQKKLKKLDEIIQVSGGSDGLNIAALGFHVVWLNSETAKLYGPQYASIAGKCEKFCILPDIDTTGKRAAHELCMFYLDMRTIVLPAALAEKRDRRGNPCKDVRDYLKYWKYKDFRKLVDTALPYKFWDEVAEYDRKGNFKGMGYDCNNTHLYWFLAQNGFYQYTTQNEVDIYIQIEGNIVREVDAKKIRKYINSFLELQGKDTNLRNKFYRSTQLNSTSFENLPHVKIDFTDYTKASQWMFFHNKTWEIKQSEIIQYKPGEVQKYVWEKELINHRVDLLPDFFTAAKNDYDDWQLTINENECMFMKFVQRTCEMHWRVEEIGVDDGNGGTRKILTPEEKREHDLHFLNKVFVLGYLLHKFKVPSSAWAVWAMENEVIENSESQGRSGKSIFLKYPRIFMKHEVIMARSLDITRKPHLLENINEFTDYVLFDDCNEYLDFSFFFPLITGPWNINPKNQAGFTLHEDDAPKIAFSSNFPPRDADGSTLDRLILTMFSDYYHYGPSEKHPERRTPRDEFGMDLFTDFDDKQWNMTLNFGAQCIKFYLSVNEKINAPGENATSRQYLSIMGDVFKNWADVYFSLESGNLNTNVQKDIAQEDCLKKNNLKWSSQKFGKSLRAWCKFYGHELNPKEYVNTANGRIIETFKESPHDLKGVSKEMIHIKSNQLRLDLSIAHPPLSTKKLDF